MKRIALALLIVLCAPTVRAQDDELARARFLDQQGVRAFAEGRYRDAMALFQESYRAGGPASELWNVARCKLKLDDAPGARRTLDEYLAQKTLSPQDRAEAQRLLDEIDHRTSTFVVASTPAGALVSVDGRAWGVTPYSGTIPAGEHDVKIGSQTKHVEARDGRAVVLSVVLGPIEHHHKHARHIKRFSAELAALATISSLGGAMVDFAPAPDVTFGWSPFTFRRTLVGFGLRFRTNVDSWSTSAGVSNAVTGCSPPNDYSAVELVAMPTVFGELRASKRVSVGARLGFGAAIYVSGTPIGGDLFAPACAYGGSLAPDAYAALDLSVRLTDDFRLVFPATLDVHTAYVGVRSDSAFDATAPWVRVGLGVALAVDL